VEDWPLVLVVLAVALWAGTMAYEWWGMRPGRAADLAERVSMCRQQHWKDIDAVMGWMRFDGMRRRRPEGKRRRRR
jgi:hypothetical protein